MSTRGPSPAGPAASCLVENSNIATGPDGEAVTDSFYFVHQPLAGNGSLTVAISSLRGTGPPLHKHHQFLQGPRTQPWAKAGILVTAGTRPGSPYAAIMATPGHGVRMQYDFTHDIAGPAGPVSAAPPKWLRLTRSGSTLTGYSSADGRHWTTVGTVNLAGLPATVQAGLFVASPDYGVDTQSFGGGDQGISGPTQAIAVFGHVSRRGDWPAGAWTGAQVGVGGQFPLHKVSSHCGASSCGTFTVAGSGDIAPFVPIVDPLQVTFYGTLFGAIAMIALGVVFITGEYRRGMIRTTLAASPRRVRVLAAKAIVIGSVTFAAGLAGATVALLFSERKLTALGWTPPVWHAWPLTSQVGVRVVIGTAALLAVTALLALAAGTILRRSAGAVTAVIALVSIPYHGCYPLAPWTGFAVMCAWAVLALGTAAFLLRRRDA